jgi:hypothetical protein
MAYELANSVSQKIFVYILTTLWTIWWAGRKAIHEDVFQSALSTHSFIANYDNELDGVKKTVAPTSVKQHRLLSGFHLPWVL